jgi:small subunit ribosomal protein S16
LKNPTDEKLYQCPAAAGFNQWAKHIFKEVILAVRLRLRRMGKKKQPFYRIVAIDSRAARDGKYIESLGTYDPRQEPAKVQLVEARAQYWLDQGAKPSDTVYGLLQRKGLLLRRHLTGLGAEDAKVQEEMQKWETAQADKLKRREAAKAQRQVKAKAATPEPAAAAEPEAVAAEAAQTEAG